MRRPNPSAFSTVLHDSPVVQIGRFEIAADHPSFRDAGAIGDRVELVFPGVPVVIEQEGRRPFVADPTRTVWYAPRQRYARTALGAGGDRSRWLAFEASTVEAAASAAVRSTRPADALASRRDGCPPEALLLHDRLFGRLERRGSDDGLAVDELALRLLALALRGESGAAAPRRPSPADRRLARRVEEILALRCAERWTLAALAAEAGSSPFHLARSFRRVTGRSIHRHLVRLRLRQALDRVGEARTDLAGLALDLGFSSHSHFSALFRREYGVSPSAAAGGRIFRISSNH